MKEATQTMTVAVCGRASTSGDLKSKLSLMAMPTELRLQIYGHLMETGKVVHVGEPGNIVAISNKFTNVCVTTQSDARTYEAVKSRLHDKGHPLQRRHRACCASQGLKATLPLLQACRMVNSEAMGVLLGSNEFTFSEPADMERFMKRLPLRQHCLLKHITIYVTGFQPKWGRPSYRWMFERLTGLKHANVFIELTVGHASLIQQACAESAVSGRDECIKAIFTLGDLPLKSTDVKVMPPTAPRSSEPDYRQTAQKTIAEWEEHIKRRLLGEHD